MTRLLKAMNHPHLRNKFKNLNRLIKKARSIVVAGHINPDGDDICSQLAIGEYLYSIGKKFIIAWVEDYPQTFNFLPNNDRIINITKNPINPEEYDLMIVVDSGDLGRIGDIAKLRHPGMTVVNIDHHKANTEFGDVNIVLEKACSIGEILYYFFKENHIDISYNMAVDLYVSIVTDTGSFRYDCMHREVHLIAADLLARGVVPADYTIYLNQNKPKSYIKYLALALSRLELFTDAKIAVSVIYHTDFKDQPEDETDGIIEYLGMLESVSVYILIKEKKPGFFTASLRSKYHVDVAKVALLFGGGGHMRAAGCKTDRMDCNTFREKLVESVTEQL